MIVTVTRKTRRIGVGWSDKVVTYPDPRTSSGVLTHIVPPRYVESLSTAKAAVQTYDEIMRANRGKRIAVGMWIGDRKVRDVEMAIGKMRQLGEEKVNEVTIEVD